MCTGMLKQPYLPNKSTYPHKQYSQHGTWHIKNKWCKIMSRRGHTWTLEHLNPPPLPCTHLVRQLVSSHSVSSQKAQSFAGPAQYCAGDPPPFIKYFWTFFNSMTKAGKYWILCGSSAWPIVKVDCSAFMRYNTALLSFLVRMSSYSKHIHWLRLVSRTGNLLQHNSYNTLCLKRQAGLYEFWDVSKNGHICPL